MVRIQKAIMHHAKRASGLGLATLVIAACASTPPSLLERDPWLAPGKTTLAAVQAADARAIDAAPLSADLPTLIQHLLADSPTIAASQAEYRAAIERVPQASTLPNPVLSYTYLPSPVETRVGPNEHRIQLNQAIPFPTKLIAGDSAATALARAAGAVHDRVVRDEVTRLESLYADYYYASRALEIAAQHVALADALLAAANNKFAAGRATLFDLSKAQSQRAQLGYDQLRLTEQRLATLAALNATLGRPPAAPIAPPAALASVAVALTEDQLLNLALGHQQELRELDARIRAADAMVLMADSGWLPDFNIGFMYLSNGPARMAGVADSGVDAYGVMIGLTLPLWFGTNAARSAEADAMREVVLGKKKAHLDRLRAELTDAVFRERDARRVVTLYDTQLLPQATTAMATAEQWNAADVTRMTDFLEARGVYYSFSLARERAVADQFKAVVRIEQLIGATLAPGVEVRP